MVQHEIDGRCALNPQELAFARLYHELVYWGMARKKQGHVDYCLEGRPDLVVLVRGFCRDHRGKLEELSKDISHETQASLVSGLAAKLNACARGEDDNFNTYLRDVAKRISTGLFMLPSAPYGLIALVYDNQTH